MLDSHDPEARLRLGTTTSLTRHAARHRHHEHAPDIATFRLPLLIMLGAVSL